MSSAFSTPEATPLRVRVVEVSTPWSDILLNEIRTIRCNTPLVGWRGRLKHGSTGTSRTRQRCLSRILVLAVLFIIGMWWFLSKGRLAIHYQMEQLYLHDPKLDGLKFIDAGHPYIRYVGRWSTSPDGTHKDGPFPGVYFDFALQGSRTVLLSLHNAEPTIEASTDSSRPSPSLSFLPSTNLSNADPISLLARIDDNEYIVLPNATSIIAIQKGNLDPLARHDIRIIAPMVKGDNIETLQVKGLWVDADSKLLPPETSGENENNILSEDHLGGHSPKRYKMLETVTDLPGFVAGTGKNLGASRGVLGGVMGWEYLLGEMFAIDHVTIGMDGMCLIQDCIGGRESPIGLADVFFQSGPAGSPQFAQPWHFQEYVPDVIVMNLGNSDWDSFQTYNQDYNKTMWELSVLFEETYVSMIKAIRTLAYPKYSSSTVDPSRYSHSAQAFGAGIPIFVMRPFRGQLEQATHAVVDRLQRDGDKSIFWLDTSGWLNTEIDFDGKRDDQDFFLDGSSSKQWRLTERGNQRVAILLHMHVCRYLAQESEKCAFLPPEIYQGKALDHEAIRFNDFLDDERERKLKKLFWKRNV